ncbi:MAG: copper chaperone PCu(A)C [Acidimicrobiales bacterium]
MRSSRLVLVVIALLALASCGGGGSASSASTLGAEGAWARPTPGGAAHGGVYQTRPADRADDAVVAASVPATVAGEAQLHQTMGADGARHHHGGGGGGGSGDDMASMAPVRSLPVAPGAPLVLEPGGNHIMLVDLAEPLAAGRRFTLTLRLRSGRSVVVPVRVQVNPPA